MKKNAKHTRTARSAGTAKSRRNAKATRTKTARPRGPARPARERGRVSNLFPAEDYGLLATDDGRELYFDRGSVAGDFEDLLLGEIVEFEEAPGEERPEAMLVAALEEII